MCKDKMCKDKCSCVSPDKRKCSKKYIIKCLPYTIHKPGNYCIAKDFVWSDPTKSAITVTSDNVVLDFKTRVLTTTVSSDLPLILVNGVTDVVLENIHIKAIGDAKYLSDGIEIRDSCNVVVESASLINLNVALFTDHVNGLDIDHLYLKNELPEPSESLILNDSENIKFHDSFTTRARCVLRQCESVDVRNIETSGLVLSECLRVDSLNGGKNRNFDFSVPPLRISQHIRISNNIFINAGEDIGIGILLASFVNAIPDQPFQYPIRNVTIENNVIQATLAIFMNADGSVANNNTIQAFANGFGVGGMIVGGEGNTIKNNDISALYPNGGSPNDFISWGIVHVAPQFQNLGTKYNTIDHNTVSGFTYGYTDNINFFLPNESFCTVFKNNVAYGNVTNFDITLGAPTETVYALDNIDACPIVPISPASVSKKVFDKSELSNLFQKLK